MLENKFLACLCCGSTPADWVPVSCPEVVLDFLQWATTSLWYAHSVEEQTDHTHHHKPQVGHKQGVPVHQVRERMGERKGRQPADCDT